MKWHFLITVLGYVGGIDLSNRGLTDVPLDIPANETEVYLQKNDIAVIQENAFVTLPELRKLILADNVVDTIEPGAFNGLVQLTNLNLERNKLKTFFDISFVSSLSSLTNLNVGSNNISIVDTTQLDVLDNLRDLGMGWNPLKEITPFPIWPKLKRLIFRGNGMATFSSKLFKNLSGLKVIVLAYNKLSSFPELGGLEQQITQLDLMRNRFLHMPDLRKYTNLIKLDISHNYITLVPEESLSHIQRGIVILSGNHVICVSELCWLVSDPWPFDVRLTCPDGTPWTNVDQLVICDGKISVKQRQ